MLIYNITKLLSIVQRLSSYCGIVFPSMFPGPRRGFHILPYTSFVASFTIVKRCSTVAHVAFRFYALLSRPGDYSYSGLRFGHVLRLTNAPPFELSACRYKLDLSLSVVIYGRRELRSLLLSTVFGQSIQLNAPFELRSEISAKTIRLDRLCEMKRS